MKTQWVKLWGWRRSINNIWCHSDNWDIIDGTMKPTCGTIWVAESEWAFVGISTTFHWIFQIISTDLCTDSMNSTANIITASDVDEEYLYVAGTFDMAGSARRIVIIFLFFLLLLWPIFNAILYFTFIENWKFLKSIFSSTTSHIVNSFPIRTHPAPPSPVFIVWIGHGNSYP